MNPNTNENKCRTISWPTVIDDAMERVAREKGISVSAVLRQWVVPLLRERDQRFDQIWTLRTSRIMP